MKKSRAFKLDNIGMTASTLCAIHCAAVPVFFSSLPVLGLDFLANRWIEWFMIGVAMVVGVSAIWPGYFKHHRKLLPFALFISGFAIILIGHLFGHNSLAEAIVVPIGGITIAVAHFINYKYIGTCNSANNVFHIKHSHDTVNPPANI
ncbi:MerC domain-containing protein [Mucilaginibacter pallidiroseus]|uniref:MerC domain-containing protein n=1 Tax=Mucilaginibacter pallidiroseus TaxID=2599295 RepID=A0A563U3G8_9SPHI|nr:MerC domain-containing protein [Mucilaginibacter pallidiroseus]TWR25880.1 MerC domain-containing protein [Mucilaginibacter pallidiroseus]